MCLNPRWIYKKGKYKENNYHGMAGEPYEIGTYSKCGSCSVCINEKCNNWVVRNHFESRSHERACFITLTYAENPYIIIKKDFVDFMKRLRITLDRTTGEKIRYMASHEYGARNGRPHHHAIIYGWDDNETSFLTINKKKKLVLKSELIEKCWGLGRTSYQEFNTNNTKEISYITLYNTPQEAFKKGYKMSREKLKQLLEISRTSARFDDKQRKNLQDELLSIQAEMDEKKLKYKLLRESNSWSIGLGWEEFEKEYYQSKNYVFEHYIDEYAFVTPSPWVKKLANMGDIAAAEEMRRREEELEQSATEHDEIIKNTQRVMDKRKKEIEKWQNEQKTVVESL